MRRLRETHPTWRYDPETGIVRVYGSDFPADLRGMKTALEQGEIPISMTALVYQSRNSNVRIILMTGHHLSDWMIADWPYPIGIFYTFPRRATS